MVTIKEIAKKANVSVAAVSYALNNKSGIGEKKRKQIRELAEQMGYIPNSIAKSLQSKYTNVIGVIIPELSNTYNSELLLNLENEARQKDYYLLLGSTHNNLETGKVIIEKFIEKNVDALVIVVGQYTSEEYYRPIAKRLDKLGIPVVFIGARFNSIKANFIELDLPDAMYELTNRLIQKIHSDNLVFFGGKMDEYYTFLRINGIKKSFSERGFKFKSKHHFNIGKQYTFQNGYKAINEYIKRKRPLPEAILAINDMVAYGVLKGLQALDPKVSSNILLTGCDNIFIPSLNDISLTTIQIPIREISNITLDIIEKTKQNPGIVQQINLPLQIIDGETA